MKVRPCAHELETLAAVRHGKRSPALLHHLATCDSCAASARLAEHLAADARAVAAAFPHRGLPPASLLWRRHQLARQRAATLRTLRRPTRIVTVLAALYLLALAVWTTDTLRSPLRASFGHATLYTASLHTDNLLVPGALLTLLLLAAAAATFLATSRPLAHHP